MGEKDIFTKEEYEEIKGKEIYIEDAFHSFEPKAEETLEDCEKTKCIVSKARKKAEKYQKGPINKLLGEMKVLFSMVNDYANKVYTKIPYGSIVAIVAALIYFISPIDFMPDFIPFLGCIDDAFVIGLVLKQIEADINLYKEYTKSAS